MTTRSRLLAALLLPAALLTVAAGGSQASPAPVRDAEPSTLHVTIDDIRPLAPVETSTLVVNGTVENLGTTSVSSLVLTLINTGAAGSRGGLDAFRTAPGRAGNQLVTERFPRGLAVGGSTGFTLKVPMVGRLLGTPSLVYELAVEASGSVTKGGATAPLGVAALPLPYFTPTAPIKGSLRTALIIPMTEVPDQGPVPLYGAPAEPVSATLLRDLRPDGRLDRLLSAVQAAPPAGGTGGTRITLAIDPSLLDRVCALAGRCGLDTPVGAPKADTQLASDWLSRLSAAVASPDVTVVGLPYADADVEALASAGDTEQVVSLLQQAGTRVYRDINLAATTDLQVLLPVDGLAGDALASAAVRAGNPDNTVAVLSPSQLQAVTPAADAPVTPSASVQLETSSGRLQALITDPTLETMLSTVAPGASPRVQEQNLLAELAVIVSTLPNQQPQRTVALVAPRNWDVPVAFSTALINDLGAVSYVHSEPLQTIATTPGPLRRRLADPPPASTLPKQTIATVDTARTTVAALRSVAADPSHETLSPPYGEGLDRALSAWWRGGGAAEGAAELASVTNDLTSVKGRVAVSGGKNGVLLTGPSGKLPVQVSNQLDEKVAIVVHVETGGLDQVTGRDVPLSLAPTGSSAYQVSVPITTRSTRDVTVTMQLLARSDPSQVIAVASIPVRSTSVGKVAVGITATALTFLVLLILFRGVRRIAARRRGEPVP